MAAGSMWFRSRLALSCSIGWIVLAGCGSSNPMSIRVTPRPEPAVAVRCESPRSTSGWTDFHPLAQGNRWTYDREFSVNYVVQGQPVDRFVYRSTIDREQTCRQVIQGRSYQVERHLETSEGGDEYLSWLRLRQDREGLYEYDGYGRPECEVAPFARPQRTSETAIDPAATIVPKLPASQREAVSLAIERQLERVVAIRQVLGQLSSGVSSDEIQRLAYPLHTGAAWVLRADPHITQRVQGVDPIHTAAGTVVGYRIDLVWTDFFGPNDRVTLWYGRQGMLGLAFHLEGTATDASGNVIGTLISDERQTLTGLHITNASRFSEMR